MTPGNDIDICMLVDNPVTFDSRVRKEASSLARNGWTICVVGINDAEENYPAREELGGIEVRRVAMTRSKLRLVHDNLSGTQSIPSRLLRYVISRVLNLARVFAIPGGSLLSERATQRKLANEVERVGARVFHAHDFPALVVMDRALQPRGTALLIYDSHEYFFGRRSETHPLRRLHARRLARRERRLARSADAIVTVSDGIAEILGRKWGLEPPVVIRNSVDTRRIGVPHELGFDRRRTVVHSGTVALGRNLDRLVEALPLLSPDTHIAMMGNARQPLQSDLIDLAGRLGVGTRLRFMPPVPMADIAPTLAGAAVGVCLNSTTIGPNYRFSLPNKFFEYVAAGLPVVVSRGPDMAGIVDSTGIGVVCDETSPRDIASAIEHVLSDAHYEGFCDRVRAAQSDLSWERDEQALYAIYGRLLTR